MTAFERMKARLPDADNDLCECLLEDARDAILAYIGPGAKEIPPVLVGDQVQIALSLYNRIGVEGERSHSEGGVSFTVDDWPAGFERRAAMFRRGVVGR